MLLIRWWRNYPLRQLLLSVIITETTNREHGQANRSHQNRRFTTTEQNSHGTSDQRQIHQRTRANTHYDRVLQTESDSWSHHQWGHWHITTRIGMAICTRTVEQRTGRGVEASDQSCPRGRRCALLVFRMIWSLKGRIVAQLWHMGRIVHPSFLNGEASVSSSDTRAPGEAHTYNGKQEYTVAKALTKEGISSTIQDYRNAAQNALGAWWFCDWTIAHLFYRRWIRWSTSACC